MTTKLWIIFIAIVAAMVLTLVFIPAVFTDVLIPGVFFFVQLLLHEDGNP